MVEDNTSTDWGKEMDADEHIQTYDKFIQFSKWGTIICSAIVLWLIYLFLVKNSLLKLKVNPALGDLKWR